MNQIDYKKQYKLDNIFNICIISLAFIAQDYKVALFAVLIVGFMVNTSSARFFYDKKYSDDTDKENKENKPAITSVWKVYYDWEPDNIQFKVNAVTRKEALQSASEIAVRECAPQKLIVEFDQ